MTKVDLRKASINSGLLFEGEKVMDSLKIVNKMASISFQQAAARNLVKTGTRYSIARVELSCLCHSSQTPSSQQRAQQ